ASRRDDVPPSRGQEQSYRAWRPRSKACSVRMHECGIEWRELCLSVPPLTTARRSFILVLRGWDPQIPRVCLRSYLVRAKSIGSGICSLSKRGIAVLYITGLAHIGHPQGADER